MINQYRHKTSKVTEISLRHSLTETPLHHPSHFKEPLEVVDLAERHGHQDLKHDSCDSLYDSLVTAYQGFKEAPHDHPAVGVLIDGAVDPVSHLKCHRISNVN